MQTYTLEEYRKLRKAIDLIGDVQVPRAKEDSNDAANMWHRLYQIRCELGQETFIRRPPDWNKVPDYLEESSGSQRPGSGAK